MGMKLISLVVLGAVVVFVALKVGVTLAVFLGGFFLLVSLISKR
jgi:hypothetical protein